MERGKNIPEGSSDKPHPHCCKHSDVLTQTLAYPGWDMDLKETICYHIESFPSRDLGERHY